MERRLVDLELLNKILFKVKRPAQYSGNEINSIIKDDYKTLITFIFPDKYEVGMSHLGGTILHHILNKVDGVSCQRAFMPDLDMVKALRENNLPIYTLEEKIDISTSDSVMFSLLYELNYTNVLEMLDISKIPIYYKDRTENHPLIIGGGSIMINPKPIADFFDCIVVGDGEEVLVEVAEILKLECSREEKLKLMSEIAGVWVPKFGEKKIKFRRVYSIEPEGYPTKRIVPNIKPIHDRISVEVMRGCVRGCRYCNAGMIYRPFREKSLEEIFREVINTHQQTGFDEVGYLSLSTTDYSDFSELVLNTIKLKKKMGINFSIPSTRLDKLPIEMEELDFAKNSLTLAPECGTDKLRKIINKNITNDEIIESVDYAFKNGWQTIKLYFMVGLPYETDEDIDGIIELVTTVKELAYKYGGKLKTAVNVSLGAFTPRPLTAFQWAKFESIDSLMEKFKKIKSSLKDRKIKVSFRDPSVSLIETIMVRGDEKISALIYSVWKKGILLQGWEEHLEKYAWIDEMKNLNLDLDYYAGELSLDENLPWDFIDSGVKRSYLASEYLKSKDGEVTDDCKYGACSGCGICGQEAKNIEKPSKFDVDTIIPENYKTTNGRNFIRLVSTQQGSSVYLANKDYRDKIKKALIIAGVPLVYSDGFSHKLRSSFSDPNNFGVYSDYEMAEFESTLAVKNSQIEVANQFLPEGVEITSLKNSNRKFEEAISGFIKGTFEIEFFEEEEYEIFKEKISDKSLSYMKKNKQGKLKEVNINERIESINFIDEEKKLEMDLFTSGEKSLRFDLLFEVTNSKNYLDIVKITKKNLKFSLV